MITFASISLRISNPPFCAVAKSSIASSDVERKTAKRVPNVIIPLEYRFAHITENPHCGIQPKTVPISGPALREWVKRCWILSSALCSRNSIIKNAVNKKGSVLRVSDIESRRMCGIEEIEKEETSG